MPAGQRYPGQEIGLVIGPKPEPGHWSRCQDSEAAGRWLAAVGGRHLADAGGIRRGRDRFTDAPVRTSSRRALWKPYDGPRESDRDGGDPRGPTPLAAGRAV